MKLYEGKPGTPGRVTVRKGSGKAKQIKFRSTHTPPTITWAKTDLALAWIALAILDDVFGQSDRTLRLMQRFKWRVAPNWKEGIAWSITEDEVREVVKDIEKTEIESSQGRRIVQLQPAPVVSEVGPDIEWDTKHTIVNNLKKAKP